MISTTLFPGRYVQGYEAFRRLGREMARFGDKAYLICADRALYDLLPNFKDDIERDIGLETQVFGGECSDEEIGKLAGLARASGCSVIAGMGGGKTLDTAKAVAHELKLPVACAPTIASTDAPCSALAVVYTATGEFKRYLVLPKNPELVIVDTKVVVEAPPRFLVSGMGDALATWFEAESCRKGYSPNMSGDIGSRAAYTLASLCYETLLEYGLLARLSCEAQAVTPALERIVEANTLLSGLGFESGGLGAAHAIHNGLTALEASHSYWHGEKVAFGTLASLFLTDKPRHTIEEVYDFCEEVGLPTTLDGVGLGDASDADLMKVAELATAEGETIYNEPIPVTAQMVFSAMKAADAEGRWREGMAELGSEAWE